MAVVPSPPLPPADSPYSCCGKEHSIKRRIVAIMWEPSKQLILWHNEINHAMVLTNIVTQSVTNDACGHVANIFIVSVF